MRFGGILAAAALRFLGLLALSIGAIAAGSLILALLGAGSFRRLGALGLYCLGSLLLVGGFMIGNRGPVRPLDSGRLDAPPIPILGVRRLRYATREEQEESVNLGAIVVALGLALIALGVAVDASHDLV